MRQYSKLTSEEQWDRVLALYPNWRKHLNDGRVIDSLLEAINKAGSHAHKCAHGNCTNRVCGEGVYCEDCRNKAREYMRAKRKLRETKPYAERKEYFKQRYAARKAASA